MGGIFSPKTLYNQLKPVIFQKDIGLHDGKRISSSNIDILFYNASSKEIIPIEKSRYRLFNIGKYSPYLFSSINNNAYSDYGNKVTNYFYNINASRTVNSLDFVNSLDYSIDSSNIVYDITTDGQNDLDKYTLNQNTFNYVKKAIEQKECIDINDILKYWENAQEKNSPLTFAPYYNASFSDLNNHKGFFFKPILPGLPENLDNILLELLAQYGLSYHEIIFYYDFDDAKILQSDGTYKKESDYFAYSQKLGQQTKLLELTDYGFPNISILSLYCFYDFLYDATTIDMGGSRVDNYNTFCALWAFMCMLGYNNMGGSSCAKIGMIDYIGIMTDYDLGFSDVKQKNLEELGIFNPDISQCKCSLVTNFSIGTNTYINDMNFLTMIYDVGKAGAIYQANKISYIWAFADRVVELASNPYVYPTADLHSMLKNNITHFYVNDAGVSNIKYIYGTAPGTNLGKKWNMCFNCYLERDIFDIVQNELSAKNYTDFTKAITSANFNELKWYYGTYADNEDTYYQQSYYSAWMRTGPFRSNSLPVSEIGVIPFTQTGDDAYAFNCMAMPFVQWNENILTIDNVTADNVLDYKNNPKKGYFDTQYLKMKNHLSEQVFTELAIRKNKDLVPYQSLLKELLIKKAFGTITAEEEATLATKQAEYNQIFADHSINIFRYDDYIAKDIADSYKIYIADKILLYNIYNTEAHMFFDPYSIIIFVDTMFYPNINGEEINLIPYSEYSDITQTTIASILKFLDSTDTEITLADENKNLGYCQINNITPIINPYLIFKNFDSIYIKADKFFYKMRYMKRITYLGPYGDTTSWDQLFSGNFTGQGKLLDASEYCWLANSGFFKGKLFLTDLKIKYIQ